MIVPDDNNIPMLVKNALKLEFERLYADVPVFNRSVRTSDGVQAIGILGDALDPDEDSKEIGQGRLGMGPAFSAPTKKSYTFYIQGLVTDTDTERGISTHHAMASWIYNVLARSEPLRVALAALVSIDLGYQERVTRWDVRRQRYRDDSIDGRWLAMSMTEFWVETVSTKEM